MAMMTPCRTILAALACCLALSACSPPTAELAFGPDGRPLPVLYRIDAAATPRIRSRMLDGVNALRAAAVVPPLALDTELTTAAAIHARDMALQNRPWHFGSDGSLPIDRAARAGYRGTVLGETVAETYDPELETVAAWMIRAETRDILIAPDGRDLGIAFFQDDSGKIWWTLLVGDGGNAGPGPAPTR